MIEKSKYFQYLVPDATDKLEERVNDFIWVDMDEIICSVPKEVSVPVSHAEIMNQIQKWEDEFGLKMRKMVIVVNPHARSTKKERDFVAEIFPKYISALAIINNSALGRMSINLFLGLKPPPYPLKVFKDQIEAKTWLLTIEE
jgi:hypothetical protein